MSAKILTFPTGLAPSAVSILAEYSIVAPRSKARAKEPTEPLPLSRTPRLLTHDEEQLQNRILDGFFVGRRGSQGYEKKSALRDRDYVEQFLSYVGQPVWACTPEDFESWTGSLGLLRHLATGTQRIMQSAVATFFDYASSNPTWQNQTLTSFNSRTSQVVLRENRIVHTCDNTPTIVRRYLVADELNNLFRMLEQIVEVASFEAPRMLKTFQRDRAMFYTYYAFGLRLAEGRGLDVHSFSPNPDLPELGRFGTVGVAHGKGSRGSGQKFRTVPALLPDVRPMLEWYLEEVRPQFRRCNPDEMAMWLSEQGQRISRAAIALRYKRLIRLCGLDPTFFSPHGLRHMHVSHQAAANVPTLFTSRSVGHSDPAVTARYTHLGDDYSRDVAFNYVHAALDAARKKS